MPIGTPVVPFAFPTADIVVGCPLIHNDVAGSRTLVGGQDIRASASPTFVGLTLSGLAAGAIPYLGAGGSLTYFSGLTFAATGGYGFTHSRATENADVYANRWQFSHVASAAGTYFAWAGWLDVATTVTESSTNYVYGIYGDCTDICVSSGKTLSGYIRAFWGDAFINVIASAGVVSALYGLGGQAGINRCSAGTVVTNAYAIYGAIGNQDADGTIENAYGLYLAAAGAVGVITNNWGIYQAGTAERNYFGGKTGLGIAPTAVLHIKAGTAVAATAPLKFTTGALLGAPEAGAIEFLVDDFYATITTSVARKMFVLNDGAALTSGVTPVASTNGRLIDGKILTSGAYSATVTARTNCAVTSPATLYYARIGNIGIVSGTVVVDPTVGGGTLTEFDVSLPVATDFSVHYQAQGAVGTDADVAEPGKVRSDDVTDTVWISWEATDTAVHRVWFFFLYQIT